MIRLAATITTLLVPACGVFSPNQGTMTPEPPAPPAPIISEIGGTPVPFGLDCQEDEVIYFTGPDTLGCVHVDSIGG